MVYMLENHMEAEISFYCCLYCTQITYETSQVDCVFDRIELILASIK